MEKFRRDDIDKAARFLWCALVDAADGAREDLTAEDREVWAAVTKHPAVQDRLRRVDA